MILYLNDIPKEYGATTNFPNLGIKVQPKKNSALFFKNLMKGSMTEGNPKTLHSGEPLLTDKIEKWAVNCWIRNTPYLSKK